MGCYSDIHIPRHQHKSFADGIRERRHSKQTETIYKSIDGRDRIIPETRKKQND